PSVTGEDVIKKEYVAPRNATEQKMVEIWQEVLGVKRVGITDSFFDLGGNSLNAIQIILRIFKEFSVEISFEEFFNKPSVQLIYDLIAEQSKTAKWLQIGNLIEESGEFEEVLI
ncbi:phosphopantetheine-binding protein, partial [Flavobacterium sp. ZB4P13]|uniref:phosphopantetheine-binding protein n=1 Tax=Flavobacterium sp. ZB4P13 TaxID=3401728 RepID=UPI003AAB4D08